MTQRTRVCLCATGMALALAAAATAGESWRGKAPAAWSQEEALQILNNSPWARTVEFYQPSGRKLGVYPNGRKVVIQDSPTSPSRLYVPEPRYTEAEMLRAVYAVRWSSAKMVQEALERLKQDSTVLADAQAPPPELPADAYVLTVRVVEPPTESSIDHLGRPSVMDEHGRLLNEPAIVGRDIFEGLSDDALQAAAELRLPGNVHLKPARAQRYGLGTSEGISFYFARTADGRLTVPATAGSVEFQFHIPDGTTLKAKFKPAEMQASGKPDY